MRKIFITLLLIITTIIVSASSISANNTNVLVYNHNQILNFPAVITHGHTLVPARSLFETVGAVVQWEPETQTVMIIHDGSEINITIDCVNPTVNGTASTLDVPAQIINGNTFIPLRFIGDKLGYYTDWDKETRTAFISKSTEELTYLKASDKNTRVLYTEIGIASWYGGGEALSRYTASGEVFNTNKLTAAHRELPFGTYVNVTFLQTGKSTIVRINDRGPNKKVHPDRIIDLSRAAAKEIGLTGIGEVKIEVLKN